MQFSELLAAVGDRPAFEAGWLMVGRPPRPGLRQQPTRWTKAGRVCRLRRNLYAISPGFRKGIISNSHNS